MHATQGSKLVNNIIVVACRRQAGPACGGPSALRKGPWSECFWGNRASFCLASFCPFQLIFRVGQSRDSAPIHLQTRSLAINIKEGSTAVEILFLTCISDFITEGKFFFFCTTFVDSSSHEKVAKIALKKQNKTAVTAKHK